VTPRGSGDANFQAQSPPPASDGFSALLCCEVSVAIAGPLRPTTVSSFELRSSLWRLTSLGNLASLSRAEACVVLP